jgi:ketosteroid isomerase-like protein
MDISSVREAVADGNRKLGAALQRKSYADLAALYTAEALVLPPDAPIVRGRKDIESFWKETATALGLANATLKTLDLEVVGDTAYEVGEARLETGQGPATVKYVVVWRKGGDGGWRLHRDIWNGMPAG